MDKLINPNGYGSSDPSLNVSVSGSPMTAAISPYLNFDPAFLNQNDEQYILMEGVDKHKGVSHYCYQVGLPVMIGAGIGSLEGTFIGLKEAGQTLGKERRALFLNAVRDQVKVRSQPLGAIATLFSLNQFLLSQVRETQDELSHLLCGTSTGFMFRSTAGLVKCAKGGLLGFGITAVACGLYKLYSYNNGSGRSYLRNTS